MLRSLVGSEMCIRDRFYEGDYYRDLAQQRTVKNFVLQPSRGNIYADDESLLATTVPRYEIPVSYTHLTLPTNREV